MTSDLQVIVGLGQTGLSLVRHLVERGMKVAVTDSRANPPHLDWLKTHFPQVHLSLGGFDSVLLNQATKIILSPGVSLKEPAIDAQRKRGVPVIGDIELFAASVSAPVIAITGTNAKSTVTTLVGEMAKAAGYQTKVGGNLGIPVLDLLQPNTDLFVLELSSFQLETVYSLKPAVSSVLNITPDHMDRYKTLNEYQKAKLRIYEHCQVAVCNRDDPLTDSPSVGRRHYFSITKPEPQEFGLLMKKKESFLAYANEALLPTKALPIPGKHYQANALAALAIGYGFGLAFEPMLNVLQAFKGLPHRCELIREIKKVKWYNDSKGTNVGATLAAIQGLGTEMEGKIVLIAGGVGKNADFTPLLPVFKKYVRHVVLIGDAANTLAKMINKAIPYSFASDMEEAVLQSQSHCQQNDAVLLSPACASFDMFKNFEHRGTVFTDIVAKL